MIETCKCGENKIATEVDGSFAYQICSVCNDVLNVVYLGPKPKQDDSINESLLGI